MEFRPVDRAPGAFQQSVTAGQIELMCRRAFGAGIQVRSAIELGAGTYNNTYRVVVGGADAGTDRPVILRVAPEPARQYRIERELMRNEHAGLPFLAPVAALLPRTLAIDFTHDVIGRDYVFQAMLDGTPAPEGLARYPRTAWATFFGQIGSIARRIHAVRGNRFGRIAGPTFETWSGAVLAGFADAAADLDDAGLDATDVRTVATLAAAERAIFDDITVPRLLHGDLWTVNLLLEPGAPEPTVTGVLDGDRASWGDPESDWTIFLAGRRPGAERDAFRQAYGSAAAGPVAARRALYYQARHICGARLEMHRLGDIHQIPGTYDGIRTVLAGLGA